MCPPMSDDYDDDDDDDDDDDCCCCYCFFGLCRVGTEQSVTQLSRAQLKWFMEGLASKSVDS